MASLPTVGGSTNVWGTELNAYLNVEHTAGGFHQSFAGPLTVDTSIELGHATENTLSASGGKLSIEGEQVASGTPDIGSQITGDGTDWQVQAKPVFDVRDYDATGNGTTNDTAFVQAAITACGAAGGGTVLFPPGKTYLVDALTVPLSGIAFVGGGSWAWSGTTTYGSAAILQSRTAVDMFTHSNGIGGVEYNNLIFDGNSIGLSAINGIYGARTRVENCFVGGFVTAGMSLLQGLNEVIDSKFVGNLGDGLRMASDGVVSHTVLSANDGAGIRSAGTGLGGTKLSGCNIEFNDGGGYILDRSGTGLSSGNIEITGCYIENNGFGAEPNTANQIFIKGDAAGNQSVTSIRITNNYIAVIHNSDNLAGNLVHIENCRGVILSDLIFVGSNGVNTTEGYGIYLNYVSDLAVTNITALHLTKNTIHGENLESGVVSNINVHDCAFVGTSTSDSYGIFLSGNKLGVSNTKVSDYRGGSGYSKGLYLAGSNNSAMNHHYSGPIASADNIVDGIYIDQATNKLTTASNFVVTGDLTVVGDGIIKTIELGHDTDTTLSRISAGVVGVEGGALAPVLSPTFTKNIAVGTTTPVYGFADSGDIFASANVKAMEGFFAEAAPYGAGLEISDNGLITTYTNVLTHNATLTAATHTIYDPAADFDESSVDYIGQFLKVVGSTPDFIGATGEITAVTDSTHIVVSFGSTGGAEISDATGMTFVIYPRPNFYVSDNGDIHATVGGSCDASFKIKSSSNCNTHSVHLDVQAGIDGNHGLGIDFDPDTYGGGVAERINYDATAFVDGVSGVGLDFVIDNTATAGGEFHAIDVALADPTNTDLENAALSTHTGVDVIHQHLGTQASVAAAFTYDDSAGTYADVTSEFGSAASDVQMFVDDNDAILVASLTKFDQINVLLAIASSVTIKPTFHFIEDTGGTWTAFTSGDDTNGFQQNGSIRWDIDSLTDWGLRTVNQVTGAAGATPYYWIKVIRTRYFVGTPPTEDTIKITTSGTFHEWDSVGRLAIKTYSQDAEPDATDLPDTKFCFWIDTNNSSRLYMCYNQGGTIKKTEMT